MHAQIAKIVPIATDVLAWSVCMSVCRGLVSSTKTAEPIEIRF